MKKLIFLFCFFCVSKLLLAQCEEESGSKITDKSNPNNFYRDLLSQIEGKYNQGDLQCVVELFETNCILEKGSKPKLKKTFREIKEEIEADIYEVVVKAYLALDEEEIAEFYLIKLFSIRYDEDFESYWYMVRESKKRHHIAPQLLYGGGFGLNLSSVEPLQRFEIFDALQTQKPDWYNKKYLTFKDNPIKNQLFNWQFNLNLDYAFTQNFSVHTQFAYNQKTYLYQVIQEWTNKIGTREEIVQQNYNHFQYLDYFGSNILIKYQLALRTLRPTASIGLFYNGLIDATKLVKSKEIPGLILNGLREDFIGNSDQNTINIYDLLSKKDYGTIVSLGLNYNSSKMQFSVDVRYLQGFSNLVLADKRFDNSSLILDYYDILDDAKFRHLEVIGRVAFPIFYKAFKRP